MSLRDKAAKINFSDLDEPAAQPSAVQVAVVEPALPPAGKPRTGVEAITHRINLQHRVTELEQQVVELSATDVVVELDPKQIRQSRWKNRHELSFGTKAYAELKAEIEAAGGNVQPIKVRRAGQGSAGQEQYEIVYGRRRLRACLDLGFKVRAIVEDMDDLQLFKEMERENRNREDLSPWEQGVMYKDALDSKLFSSQRQLAAALNVNPGNLNTALTLAGLPAEVVAAFPTPFDLQFRWASLLAKALEENTARVMTVAAEIANLNPRPPAKEVLARLLGGEGSSVQTAQKRDFSVGTKVVGSLVREPSGALTVKFKAGTLTAANERKLVEFVEKLLA